MFTRGAGALSAALPRLPHVATTEPHGSAPVYVCPLCLEGFSVDGSAELSREHSPPRAVGGPVITLTCRSCNSAAGPAQAHAKERREWSRFVSGDQGVSVPVRVTSDNGVAVTADIEYRGEALFIVVDESRSNPVHHSTLVELLEGGNATFKLEGNVGFIDELARASDLRDAYLAAFALLGYRYILWPDLDPARELIRNHGTQPRWFKRADWLAETFVGILTLSSPVECVAVVPGDRRCVLLPWPSQAAELERWIDAGCPVDSDLAGRAHPWPADMPMLLDLGGLGI